LANSNFGFGFNHTSLHLAFYNKKTDGLQSIKLYSGNSIDALQMVKTDFGYFVSFQEWDFENSSATAFIVDYKVILLNEKGEILGQHSVSKQTIVPLAYPNPANSGNPLNIVLPHGMVG